MTNDEAVNRMLEIVKREREVICEAIEQLRIIEERKIYALRGYSSIWEFATKFLGYSEGAAYRRISALRLTKHSPEALDKIRTGALTLTNAAQAQTFSRKTKISSAEIVKRVEGKSSREAERTLLELAPQTARAEKIRAVTPQLTELKIVVDEKMKASLDRLRSLRSHKNANMSYSDLLADLVELGMRHWDPSQKRSKAPSAPKSNRRPIPSAIRTYIWKRDQGRCTFRDPKSGRKCESSHLLEIDHVKPWAQGGNHDTHNLRLLCHAHHRLRDF